MCEMEHSATPHQGRKISTHFHVLIASHVLGNMYNRSLHRSLALAASVTVTGAFAARVYRQQEEEEEAGRPASLQHHHNSLLLQSPAPLTKHIHEPVPCLPSFFLSPRPPAACAAAPAPGLPAGIPEFHQVPQPATDPADTDSIVFRMQKYFTTASLEEVAKFKKEKAGVKIYTVKEGSIPDPAIGGRKTGLPVARIGEAVINAPLEQVMGGMRGRKGVSVADEGGVREGRGDRDGPSWDTGIGRALWTGATRWHRRQWSHCLS